MRGLFTWADASPELQTVVLNEVVRQKGEGCTCTQLAVAITVEDKAITLEISHDTDCPVLMAQEGALQTRGDVHLRKILNDD